MKFIHDHADFLQVTGVHAIAGAVTFTDVNEWLKTLGLLIAIGFGLYKWYRFKKTQDKVDQNLSNGDKGNS